MTKADIRTCVLDLWTENCSGILPNRAETETRVFECVARVTLGVPRASCLFVNHFFWRWCLRSTRPPFYHDAFNIFYVLVVRVLYAWNVTHMTWHTRIIHTSQILVRNMYGLQTTGRRNRRERDNKIPFSVTMRFNMVCGESRPKVCKTKGPLHRFCCVMLAHPWKRMLGPT